MKFSANPLITLLAAIWIVPQMPAASPTTLSKVVVALKPDKDPDAMVAERTQLSKYLSDKLGRPVEVIVPLSAAVILEGLSNGTIDLAYLSATDMLNAINQRSASILLAGEIDGKTSYQSYWVTLKDKPYQSAHWKTTSPSEGGTLPARHPRRLVLPAPDGPTTAMNFPRGISTSIPRKSHRSRLFNPTPRSVTCSGW